MKMNYIIMQYNGKTTRMITKFPPLKMVKEGTRNRVLKNVLKKEQAIKYKVHKKRENC